LSEPEISTLDLFGEPVSGKEKGRGRPAHRRSRETVNRVILGLARGWSVKQTALSIGVSVPTLRQHYFAELKQRAAMALMMESVQLGRLNDQAAAGNVAAEKELMKALCKGRLEQMSDAIANRGTRDAKPKPVGKKEAAKSKAGDVRGKFAPPAPPEPGRLLN